MGWKSRIRRGLAVGLALFALRTAWGVGERQWESAEGGRELAAAFAETEGADPGWRWDALNAARPMPPAGKNGAELIPRVVAASPPEFFDVSKPGAWEPKPLPQLPTRRLPPETVAAARAALTRAAAATDLARTLKDCPFGRRDIRLAPDALSTLLPDTAHTRSVALLLRWDVALTVTDGDRERAADAVAALLNASRSLGDEPFLISQVVRIAVRRIAGESLQWALSRTELPEPLLAALQTAWATDAEEPLLLYGLRGERASLDVLLGNLQSGVVTPGSMNGQPAASEWSFGAFAWWLYRGRLPRDRAVLHRWITHAVDAARKPVEEQQAAMEALPPPPDETHRFARLFVPNAHKVAAALWWSVAEARGTAVALACERFRLRTGRFPAALTEVPTNLLASVPLDPFNGMPLRYKALPDGAVVYSVGPDAVDDGGSTDRVGDEPGPDRGFRLYNPSERGKP